MFACSYPSSCLTQFCDVYQLLDREGICRGRLGMVNPALIAPNLSSFWLRWIYLIITSAITNTLLLQYFIVCLYCQLCWMCVLKQKTGRNCSWYGFDVECHSLVWSAIRLNASWTMLWVACTVWRQVSNMLVTPWPPTLLHWLCKDALHRMLLLFSMCASLQKQAPACCKYVQVWCKLLIGRGDDMKHNTKTESGIYVNFSPTNKDYLKYILTCGHWEETWKAF